ncbi:MAG: hypothetical protein V1854_03270 [Methanobacteriota archaeon]
MATKLVIVLLLITSILFAGCLSGKENIPVASSTLDVKPQEVTVKSGENAQLMIRVTNNGKSVIHPFVRFNLNSSDKKYVKFSNESGSYDMGVLRPGEDSGFRIVDFKAELPAGKEMKYQTSAQVIYDGKVLESKDIVITVRS